MNSWTDTKVCNIHILHYADWNSKPAEPTRSVCLVLKDWDGQTRYPTFEKGEIGPIDRPDLFSTKTEIMQFGSERALLQRFYDLIVQMDPDVITGWNIFGYDLPFLEQRALTKLRMDKKELLRISKLKNRCCTGTDMSFQTAGKGSFGGKKDLVIPGRVVLDGMYALQKDFSARVRLSSFSLNAAADYYLKGSLGKHATKVGVTPLPTTPHARARPGTYVFEFFTRRCRTTWTTRTCGANLPGSGPGKGSACTV